MLILGLDTTISNISQINISENNNTLINCSININSESLILNIDKLFSICNKNVKDLDLITIINGPGSFTGLRIGISTVKTLSQVLNIPIMAFNKLELLLYNYLNLEDNNLYCPILDIKRNEVYTALATMYSNKPNYIIPPAIYNIKEWLELLKEYKNIIFKLDELSNCIKIIKEYYPNSLVLIDKNYIEAANKLAYYQFENLPKLNYLELKPFYLRDPVYKTL